MLLDMANIFDLPDFMIANVDKNKLSKIKKIIFLLKGILLGFLHKNTSGRLFCMIMNLFYNYDGNIYFKENKYFKETKNNELIYFPNKRIDRIIIDADMHFKKLLLQYSLENFKLEKKDLVIDCGANVGEMYFSLKINNPSFDYVAFEPDPKAFECLLLNLKKYNHDLYNNPLSSTEADMKFYLDTYGANSSLEYFGKDQYIILKSKTIDSFNFKKVKLLKLEAEGHELEVLKSSSRTLKNIEYISVDYGPEKGKEGNMTLPEVTNYLFKNNFIIVHSSSLRYTALFKNLNFA